MLQTKRTHWKKKKKIEEGKKDQLDWLHPPAEKEEKKNLKAKKKNERINESNVHR